MASSQLNAGTPSRKKSSRTISRSVSLKLSTLLEIVRLEHIVTVLTQDAHLHVDVGAFLNDTIFPANHNYQKPTVPYFVNGRNDPTSQRFHVSLR